MSEISAKAVMELRNKSGVSMMACKKALVEASGDLEKAIDILRKAGAEKADKKAGRATSEGAVAIAGRAAVSLQCETDFVARNESFSATLQELADVANSKGTEEAKSRFEQQRAELVAQLGENISFGEAVVIKGGSVIGSYIHSNNKLAGLVALDGGDEELARDIAMHIAANSPQVIRPEEISDELVAKEREIWEEQLKNEGKPAEIIGKIMLGKEKKFREEGALLKQAFVKDPEISIETLLQKSGAKVVQFARVEV